MSNLAELVISGLISTHNTDFEAQTRFNFVSARVEPEFFEPDIKLGTIFKISCRYFMQTGLPLRPADFESIINGAMNLEPAVKLEFREIFLKFSTDDSYLSPGRFNHTVRLFVDEIKARRMAVALSDAAQILQVGKTINGHMLQGLEDATEFLNSEQLKIERTSASVLPRGFMHESVSEMLSNYLQIRAGTKTSDGVLTGIDPIDQKTHGVHPGDLWLIGGYTGEGKSKIATNVAWHAAYSQGKNVAFCTIEQQKPQMEVFMACRHSHLPQFGLSGGIASNDVLLGALSPSNFDAYRAVLQDMEQGTKDGKYGRMFIFQVSGRSQLPLVEAELRWLQTKMPIDLVIIDYARLLISGGRNTNQREDLTNVLISLKAFARDFNNGIGVPVISPWQISREAWERALAQGRYTKSAFSDTSEAEKSADMLWTVLKKTEGELICQIVKNRNGEELEPFNVHAEFRSSFISMGQSIESLL